MPVTMCHVVVAVTSMLCNQMNLLSIFHQRLMQTAMQAMLPVLRELGEETGHRYQDALNTRLALIAAAPWKGLDVVAKQPTSPIGYSYLLFPAGCALIGAVHMSVENLIDYHVHRVQYFAILSKIDLQRIISEEGYLSAYLSVLLISWSEGSKMM